MKPRDRLLHDYWTGMMDVLGKSGGDAFPRHGTLAGPVVNNGTISPRA